MNRSRRLKVLLLLGLLPLLVRAQENIPIGAFRLHVSYNSIHDIAFDGVARTFAAASHGILIADRINGETNSFNKANGISGGTITSVAFDDAASKLIVGYVEGYFDVLDEAGSSIKYDPAATITGSRRINEVTVFEGLAYIATDYGVVVFDPVRNKVRETWRDLGISGGALAVHHCTMRSDSVFLSTPQGIIAGKRTDNLQDFNKWKRYMHWPFSNHISGVAVWQDTVFAAIDDAGLFKLVGGVWLPVSGIPVDKYFSVEASSSLIVSSGAGVFRIGADGAITRISSPLFSAVRFAAEDGKGSLWIGDELSGLSTDASGAFVSLLPQCPANDVVTNLHYANDKIFAVGGGYGSDMHPQHRRGVVDIFEQGNWKQMILPASDLTDVTWDASTQTLIAASYGSGVVVKAPGTDPIVFGETNSTLHKVELPAEGVLVPSLAWTSDGIITLNYTANPPLHRMNNQGQWESYNVPIAAARYGVKVALDEGNNAWTVIDPKQGGGIVVYNIVSGAARHLTDAPGQGGLPSPIVYSLCLDREGAMWVGTENGVAYFPNASSMLQSTVADAIKPIIEGRFVLRDDNVTAIAVDGGNRKWFGTRRGVTLYNSAVDQEIGSFTTAGSALPADNILDLEIHQQTGEVFIATELGLASYRSGATEPRLSSDPIKIFPNPVPATFTGTVGITGTPVDAVVKITDVAGKLVWETRANGSTATWNLLDDLGRRVATGVYIVFMVSDDGGQHEVGKLAVIN